MNTHALAEYLKQLRGKTGWSQAKVESECKSRGLQIDQGTISNLEKGDIKSPGLQPLYALARIYNVKLVDLVSVYEGSEPPAPSAGSEMSEKIIEWLLSMPPEFLALAFQKLHTPDELEQMVKEAKRKA